MKKIATALVSLSLCASAFAALDTSLTYHDSVLPAESTTLIQTPVLLLGPTAATNLQTVSGSEVTATAYQGTCLLVAGFGIGKSAAYTGTVYVYWGTATGVYTSSNVFTQTGTTAAKYSSAEVDMDTLQGTNAALYALATYSINDAAIADTQAVAGVSLLYGAARSATQTNTGSAVDTINYKGFGTIVVDVGTPLNGSSAYTNVVTIQHGATSTGSWTTVSAVTNTAADVDEIAYQFGKGGRYIRAVVTTVNDAGPASVTLNAFK